MNNFTYLLLLQSFREATAGIFDSFMCQMTVLAESTVTWLALAAVYWCIHKRTGQLMAWNVAIACTLNQFLKAVCKVERPWIRDERVRPVEGAMPAATGYSFPSGHTTRAIAVWGSAGWETIKRKPYRKLGVCLWILTAIILFSRNYLGVHTLWDVAGAFLLGMVLLSILDVILNWAEQKPNRDILVCAAGCLLCFLPMLKVGCLSNAGAGMGALLGWYIERRWIRFSVKGTLAEKCVRFGIGAIFVLAIQKIVSAFLGLCLAAKYAGFFTGFLLAFFVMAIYPFLFTRWKENRGIRKLAYLFGVAILAAMCFWVMLKVSELSKTENTETPAAENMQATEQTQGEEGNADIWLEEKTIPVIAHRGYSAEFPENTMPAFKGALDIGVEYIETDVQLTKDGKLVLFHDTDLSRITGASGIVSDYTYEELMQMDFGGWFDAAYAGETIPTLEELLALLQNTDCKLYLELKDIGAAEGFVEAILEEVEKYGMLERCVFASFRYEYLQQFKELNAGVKTLYNTTSVKKTLPQEFPADYYGLYIETVNYETVETIHNAGKQAFVWTVNTPNEMQNVKAMGVDGIVTNHPGLAKVMRYSAYQYVAERYEMSITVPGLYEPNMPAECSDMIVQGLARTDAHMVISAYSASGQYNSILYITDLQGNFIKIVDTGTKAHMGGIAYDEQNDLLWMTGERGVVWAAEWSKIVDGVWNGEARITFDAGLVNHNGDKVASFLAVDSGRLYVGSYVDGAAGTLQCYDTTDVQAPVLIMAAAIPERIQGVTFKRDIETGNHYMFLTQGYQMEDANLLKYDYEEDRKVYEEPLEKHLLPEGAEQPLMTAQGLYILFESSARPYRETARIPNDQIYVLRM